MLFEVFVEQILLIRFNNGHRGGGHHDRDGRDDPDRGHGAAVCGYIRGYARHNWKVPNLQLQQRQAFLN